MTVKVKKFKVLAGDEVYIPGDIISDLPEEEESRLVEEGYCDLVVELVKETKKQNPRSGNLRVNKPDEGPNTGLNYDV